MAAEILKVPIDRFGRIVLPKSIRDRLGLIAGTEFEVEESRDAIVLKPVVPRAELVEKDGWLVVTSDTELSREQTQDILDKVRKDRTRRIGGW